MWKLKLVYEEKVGDNLMETKKEHVCNIDKKVFNNPASHASSLQGYIIQALSIIKEEE